MWYWRWFYYRICSVGTNRSYRAAEVLPDWNIAVKWSPLMPASFIKIPPRQREKSSNCGYMDLNMWQIKKAEAITCRWQFTSKAWLQQSCGLIGGAVSSELRPLERSLFESENVKKWNGKRSVLSTESRQQDCGLKFNRTKVRAKWSGNLAW